MTVWRHGPRNYRYTAFNIVTGDNPYDHTSCSCVCGLPLPLPASSPLLRGLQSHTHTPPNPAVLAKGKSRSRTSYCNYRYASRLTRYGFTDHRV
jgi:hypothetical protein